MNNNINTSPNTFLRIISSIPVILLVLYFSRFLGVILILFRYFTVHGKKKISLPVILVITGIIVYIPKIINEILKTFKIDVNTIPYLKDIVSNEVYSKNFIRYGKALIIIGIIFAILAYVFKLLFNKAVSKLNSSLTTGFDDFIKKEQDYSRQIDEKNDLIMKEKEYKAKNTHVVRCPNCGADSMITGDIGTCKYCRRKVVYKEK